VEKRDQVNGSRSRGAALESERLSRVVGEKVLVNEISVQVHVGEVLAVVGPSGSGKSTLLYVLGGLDQATSGELLVDGVDVRHLSEQREHQFRRAKMGFVFQSFYLLPTLTALENVMLPMQLAGGQSAAQLRERARALLLEAGINEDRHSHRPGKLSSGQQQRVAIARAVAARFGSPKRSRISRRSRSPEIAFTAPAATAARIARRVELSIRNPSRFA